MATMFKRIATAGRKTNSLSCSTRRLSDSVTYSGGQASQGQGGFYGSGGSRATVGAAPQHHPEAIARQVDVSDLTQLMAEVDSLETELLSHGKVLSTRTIEIKSLIKKTVSNPKVREMLNRLEIKGEPVWGLSSKERDLVRAAKTKYMES